MQSTKYTIQYAHKLHINTATHLHEHQGMIAHIVSTSTRCQSIGSFLSRRTGAIGTSQSIPSFEGRRSPIDVRACQISARHGSCFITCWVFLECPLVIEESIDTTIADRCLLWFVLYFSFRHFRTLQKLKMTISFSQISATGKAFFEDCACSVVCVLLCVGFEMDDPFGMDFWVLPTVAHENRVKIWAFFKFFTVLEYFCDFFFDDFGFASITTILLSYRKSMRQKHPPVTIPDHKTSRQSTVSTQNQFYTVLYYRTQPKQQDECSEKDCISVSGTLQELGSKMAFLDWLATLLWIGGFSVSSPAEAIWIATRTDSKYRDRGFVRILKTHRN